VKELAVSYAVGSAGQRQKRSGSPQIPLHVVIDHLTGAQRIMKSNTGTPILPDPLSSAEKAHFMIQLATIFHI